MMTGLGPFAAHALFRPPVAVEILAQRPGFRIEQRMAEQVDDARGPAQIGALSGGMKPGEKGFQQMHVRVGASQVLAVGAFQEPPQVGVFQALFWCSLQQYLVQGLGMSWMILGLGPRIFFQKKMVHRLFIECRHR